MSASDPTDDEVPVQKPDELRFQRCDAAAGGWGAHDPMVLRLATIRSHDQYNTTIYALDDRNRGVFGVRRVVFMNEVDMRPRGIASGALVEIESVAKDGRRRLVRNFVARPYDIPSGSVAAYYPETNPLLPLGYHAPKSKTPAAKSIYVRVRAIATT
ncbi:MAG: putative oxidoreductase [Gammaproteobacteria bacterium]|nr:putative oxidoreductase [Gammaproteobacteria bacterium]